MIRFLLIILAILVTFALFIVVMTGIAMCILDAEENFDNAYDYMADKKEDDNEQRK